MLALGIVPVVLLILGLAVLAGALMALVDVRLVGRTLDRPGAEDAAQGSKPKELDRAA